MFPSIREDCLPITRECSLISFFFINAPWDCESKFVKWVKKERIVKGIIYLILNCYVLLQLWTVMSWLISLNTMCIYALYDFLWP